MLKFELYIANRYLRSQKRKWLLSGVSFIAVAGVIIGVAALVITLSIMNGYETEVRSSFIGVFAHGRIRAYLNREFKQKDQLTEILNEHSQIIASTPYISGKGMLQTGADQTVIFVRGIETTTAVQVTDIENRIIKGKPEFKPSKKQKWPGIILGTNLAQRMGVTLGDNVRIVSLSEETNLTELPQMIQFTITGIIKTGFYDLDNNYAYVSLNQAQQLFSIPGQISGIELKFQDYRAADEIITQINQQLEYPFIAQSWRDINPNLFAWVQMQKWTFFIVLSLIILVAAFNIASTQIMVTLEKTKEIGILMALGVSPKSILRIFTFSGINIGILGAIFGCILGYILCWIQQTYRVLSIPSDVYIVDWLPVIMKGSDFVIVAIATILIAFIASVYPAIKASQLTPVGAIRND